MPWTRTVRGGLLIRQDAGVAIASRSAALCTVPDITSLARGADLRYGRTSRAGRPIGPVSRAAVAGMPEAAAAGRG